MTSNFINLVEELEKREEIDGKYLREVLEKQKTWISEKAIKLLLNKNKKSLINIMIKKAYRFTPDAFLYILRMNLSLEKIKKSVLNGVLLPSVFCNYTKIDDPVFLLNIHSFLGLKNNALINRSLKTEEDIWQIILSQYLFRIILPLAQMDILPPYVIIEILDKIDFISEIPHEIKARYVLGIFNSRKRVLSQRIKN